MIENSIGSTKKHKKIKRKKPQYATWLSTSLLSTVPPCFFPHSFHHDFSPLPMNGAASACQIFLVPECQAESLVVTTPSLGRNQWRSSWMGKICIWYLDVHAYIYIYINIMWWYVHLSATVMPLYFHLVQVWFQPPSHQAPLGSPKQKGGLNSLPLQACEEKIKQNRGV